MSFPTSILTDILTSVLKSPDVDVPASKAPEVAKQISEVIKEDPKVTVAPVKNPVTSKINILNGGFLAIVLGWFGYNIPTTPEGWASLVVTAATPLLTIIFRTWFTKSVTSTSVK